MSETNDIREELLAELRERLEVLVAADDLPEWIGLASRAGALGDRGYLEQAPEKLESMGLDAAGLRELVLSRFKEGAWDLENAHGEFLGYAVMDAQDWAFLVELDPKVAWVTKEIGGFIRAWAILADEAELDAEAMTTIERLRDLALAGVDEDLLLPVVKVPICREEKVMVRRAAAAMREQAGSDHSPVGRIGPGEEPLRAAASGAVGVSTLVWESPQGGLLAEARINPESRRVIIEVTTRFGDGESAVVLAGRPGVLGDTPFVLDDDACAVVDGERYDAIVKRIGFRDDFKLGGQPWRLIRKED